MTQINPAFRGSYSIPIAELKTKNPQDLAEYGRKTAEIVTQGGKIEQTDDSVIVTVPFEKEQDYAAVLAKYNINAQKQA